MNAGCRTEPLRRPRARMPMDHGSFFISYVEEDGATARALAAELRALGYSTWTYEEDGVAGVSYLTQVSRAIESCRAFVLIASAQSTRAHQVISEVEQAHEREKMIIAVRLGLTHQEFVASNPILRMATGTAVTLPADKGTVAEVARRIAASVSARDEDQSSPGGLGKDLARPAPAAAIPFPPGTREAAVSPPTTPPAGGGRSGTHQGPPSQLWVVTGIATGVQVLCWPLFSVVIGLGFERYLDASEALVVGAAELTISVCGLLLAYWLATARGSLRQNQVYRPHWIRWVQIAAFIAWGMHSFVLLRDLFYNPWVWVATIILLASIAAVGWSLRAFSTMETRANGR